MRSFNKYLIQLQDANVREDNTYSVSVFSILDLKMGYLTI